MRYVVSCFLCLLILSGPLVAQEPTPPIISYEAEIGWGPLSTVFWTEVPISYTVVNGPITTPHKPTSKLGIQKWAVPACDSTTQMPKKVVLSFYITTLPSSGYNTYYMRVRGHTSEVVVNPWSDVSASVKITGNP